MANAEGAGVAAESAVSAVQQNSVVESSEESDAPEIIPIMGVNGLESHILNQSFEVGSEAAIAGPILPSSLAATGEQDVFITLEDVQWICAGYDPNMAAVYQFAVVLPTGYTLGPQAMLPIISVEVSAMEADEAPDSAASAPLESGLNTVNASQPGDSFVIGNLVYRLLPERGTVAIDGFDNVPSGDQKVLDVLAEVEYEGISYQVKEITRYAFSQSQYLERVDLSKAENLVVIGDFAFYSCDFQGEVDFTNSVNLKMIGNTAFAYCRLMTGTIDLSNTKITTIEINTFTQCQGITQAIFPVSLARLNNYAFFKCIQLVTLQFNSDVCPYMSSTLNPTFEKIADTGVALYPQGVTGYSVEALGLPNGWQMIPQGGEETPTLNFSKVERAGVGHVSIQFMVSFSGEYAYTLVDKDAPEPPVASSTPKAVTAGLNTLALSELSSEACDIYFWVYDSMGNLLFEAYKVAIPTFHESITAENLVYRITGERQEFTAVVVGWYGSSPGNISVPATISDGVSTYRVTEIGANAFYNAAITGADLSQAEHLTVIGDGAFSLCYVLKSVSLPDGVTSIGDDAFYHCLSLAKIPLPKNLVSIGMDAFSSCHAFTGALDLSGCDQLITIGDGTFSNCLYIDRAILPEGPVTVGARAFSSCISLATVNFPASLLMLGDYAFRNCRLTGTIDMSACTGLTVIGNYAFSECAEAVSVHFPPFLTDIGNGALNLSGQIPPPAAKSQKPYT